MRKLSFKVFQFIDIKIPEGMLLLIDFYLLFDIWF